MYKCKIQNLNKLNYMTEKYVIIHNRKYEL